MNYTHASSSGPFAWLRRAEDWLDARGKPAWIAAMVLGFVVFWPLGLALLAYMIWSKRMFFGNTCSTGRTRYSDHHAEWEQTRDFARNGLRSSGNATFDAYKAETLRRLQTEQEAFEAFLQRLREAKDKKEFDAFMEDRARATQADAATGTAASDDRPADPRPAGT